MVRALSFNHALKRVVTPIVASKREADTNGAHVASTHADGSMTAFSALQSSVTGPCCICVSRLLGFICRALRSVTLHPTAAVLGPRAEVTSLAIADI